MLKRKERALLNESLAKTYDRAFELYKALKDCVPGTDKSDNITAELQAVSKIITEKNRILNESPTVANIIGDKIESGFKVALPIAFCIWQMIFIARYEDKAGMFTSGASKMMQKPKLRI